MREDMLLQIFNEETTGNNIINGQRVFNNDLVASIDISALEDSLCVEGEVISEKLFNEYNTKITIDTERIGILGTSCTCLDYEKHGAKKRNYCCKHLVASFYKALEELANHPSLLPKTEVVGGNGIAIDKSNVLALLLGEEKNREREELVVEIYLNKNEWDGNISAEFKLGIRGMNSSTLYTLKDINQFLLAYYNNFPVDYSKNFIFSRKNQTIGTKDRRLIEFISNIKEFDGDYKKQRIGENRYINGKYMEIPQFMLREFLGLIK